ncbi:major facilitator superfamily domain-containing protein [Biscogniauxia sp. FL1348]|nr:major facilitator superfamily domain-containing protein [Biscogniauxia sp. FL1348]
MPLSFADQRADPPKSNSAPNFLTPIRPLRSLSLWPGSPDVEATNINSNNNTNSNSNTSNSTNNSTNTDTNPNDKNHTESHERQVNTANSVAAALPLPKASGTRIPLKASDCAEELGYAWPMWRKCLILIVIFFVQVSMNLNTTLYSNAVPGIAAKYGVSEPVVLWGGAASFLMAYAFGCEFWAPWSEEFGRRRVLQASLGLVNLFAVLSALAPNFPLHALGRALGGLSTAGGSVTLAVITDLFKPEDVLYQHATLFIVLGSLGGSIIGPIAGGFLLQYCPWQWCLWVQVIVGVVVMLLHAIMVPETRVTILMDRIARIQRKTTVNSYVYGPGEVAGKCIDWAKTLQVWMRPFRMFLTEPIVLTLSLLSGFSDALIFMMIQSFSMVYRQWHFSHSQLGMAFIPIGIGYILAYFSFFPAIMRNVAQRERNPGNERSQYEARLWWLLWTVPLLPVGLLVFALTAMWAHPPVHWIGSMVGSGLIGVANFAIYMATIDYMLRAYGPYAASATASNGWARDFLAGLLTPFAIPMYERLRMLPATIILFSIATMLCVAVYAVYSFGPALRHRSPFAQTLAAAEDENDDHVVAYLPPSSMTGSRGGSRPDSRPASQRNPRPGPLSSPAVAGFDLGSVSQTTEPTPLIPLSPLPSTVRQENREQEYAARRMPMARRNRRGTNLSVLTEVSE